ncbi:MAG: multicopper oxidase domain-containing protein [Proteobacteria bacterium]|nr:multicopper oxidase domain-containing protein [Pseudomonadota bacterium]
MDFVLIPLRSRIRSISHTHRLAVPFDLKGVGTLVWLALCMAFLATPAHAQATDPADQICPRWASGSGLQDPPDLRSQNGVLEVTFQFKTTVDARGLTRYCFVTDTGLESPTLHVLPGDQLIIHLQNTLPMQPVGMAMTLPKAHLHAQAGANNDCAGGAMGTGVTNLHFHGLNVPPTCHQDEVINTLVQPTQSFDYTVQIPADEPTGIYWYHPHPHGFSNLQVLGGASGAIMVEGIENVVPAVAGLPQRILVIRDQLLPQGHGPSAASLDLSVNYVPVTSSDNIPATLPVPASTTEFWRVLNASADTELQLQYVVEGGAQPMQVVAVDGVPVGQGTGAIQPTTQTSVALGPGARAEFTIVTPSTGHTAQLITQAVDTGPAGARTPQRTLAIITAQSSSAAAIVAARSRLGQVRTAVRVTRFAQMASVNPDGLRALYFSENLDIADAAYYITEHGQTPVAYAMGAAPAITLHQGTTEDWVVENRSAEDHVFHIHQTRFQTLAVNGQAVSDPALRDTINVPHWSGTGPYPSVKLRMDFRPANIVGTFVYHCHILAHEDLGMMQAIQVLPSGVATSTTVSPSASEVVAGAPVTLTASLRAADASANLAGTVQFFDGDVPLGNPVLVTAEQAVLTAPLSGYGMHALSASYSGDTTRNQSLSAAVTVAVEDFALAAPAISIKSGDSAIVPVTMTTSDGFSSSVAFSCAVPAALTGVTCTASPESLNAAGAITLQIKTGVTGMSATLLRFPATLAIVGCLAVPWRRRRRGVFLAAASAALTLVAVGCSSSHTTAPITPPGNYTIAVTGTCGGAAAPITHTLSVAVQIL